MSSSGSVSEDHSSLTSLIVAYLAASSFYLVAESFCLSLDLDFDISCSSLPIVLGPKRPSIFDTAELNWSNSGSSSRCVLLCLLLTESPALLFFMTECGSTTTLSLWLKFIDLFYFTVFCKKCIGFLVCSSESSESLSSSLLS